MDSRNGDNLFVYGTLMDDANVRSLTGRTFSTEPAILWDYERIVPNMGYPYIVPKPGLSVSGVVLKSIDRDSLFRLDNYEREGDLYDRIKVVLEAEGSGTMEAYVYVGRPHTLKAHYGDDIVAAERVKEYLEERACEMVAANGGAASDPLRARAERELRSLAMYDLLESHLRDGPPSEFAVRLTLEESPLPTLKHIHDDPDAARYADNYVRLAVLHMIFNQIEDRIHHRVQDRIKVADSYYEHTISNLVALTFMNELRAHVDARLQATQLDRLAPGRDYIDYAIGAVRVADEIYDAEKAKDLLHWVKAHRQAGVTPLGAEIEMSHLGGRTIKAAPGQDPVYDGFYYFHDFDLMARSWKLGGYLDNHQNELIEGLRSRGFFEYAFGRYKIVGDLSKPATDDPWVLNELIHQALDFTRIPAHSLHLSIQPPKPIQTQEPCDPNDLICFLMLGGDIRPDGSGLMREHRFHDGELVHHRFSLVNSHMPARDEMEEYYYDTESEEEVQVIEYQFARLNRDRNYQPLIMALKGYQIAANPRPVNRDQPNPELDDLVAWAEAPKPLPGGAIQSFLAKVRQGLREEASHSPQYIDEMLAIVRRDLRKMNERLAGQG